MSLHTLHRQERPRPLVAKLLHFQDRATILRAARRAVHFMVGNRKVLIFQDYALAVQRHRASSAGVKRKLQEMGLKCALLFPSKIKIILDN